MSIFPLAASEVLQEQKGDGFWPLQRHYTNMPAAALVMVVDKLFTKTAATDIRTSVRSQASGNASLVWFPLTKFVSCFAKLLDTHDV